MIDIETYRTRIGMFSPRKNLNKNCMGNFNRLYEVLNSQTPIKECLIFILYLLLVIYFATVAMITVISLTVCPSSCCNYKFDYIRPLGHAFSQSAMAVTNTKIFFLILASFAVRRARNLSWFISIYEGPKMPNVDTNYRESRESISTPTRLYSYLTHNT